LITARLNSTLKPAVMFSIDKRQTNSNTILASLVQLPCKTAYEDLVSFHRISQDIPQMEQVIHPSILARKARNYRRPL
jgi:hypothetical protein